jgi:hypothetical protein
LLPLEASDSEAGKFGDTKEWEEGEFWPANTCNIGMYSPRVNLTH